MRRFIPVIFIFSISFAIFLLLPPFLNKQFALFPLMKTADVFDIITPLVLIPLYWLLYKGEEKISPGTGEVLLFLILAAAWVEGHGIHLSSNSIGHWLKGIDNSSIKNLTDFYDEALSHYLWHASIMGLSALIIVRQRKNPSAGELPVLWIPAIAGVIYGFTYFAIMIEGKTYPLGLPFALFVSLFILGWYRKSLRQQPALNFFLIAHLVALVLFALWAAMWGGFPQFSDVGIIE